MVFFFFALVAFALVVLLVVVSTVGFTLASLVTLLSAPAQLKAMLRDRQLRRNHALEHATINVIEERFGRSNLAGVAEHGGFTIQGRATPDLVASAAHEALERLKAGERRLALHARCGSSMIAGQLLLGIVFIAGVIWLHDLSWIAFAAGLLAAIVLGPRLSLVLQRFVTTDVGVGNLQISSIDVKRPTGRMGVFSLVVLGPIFVHTEESSASRRTESTRGDVTLITGDREEIPAGGYRVR